MDENCSRSTSTGSVGMASVRAAAERIESNTADGLSPRAAALVNTCRFIAADTVVRRRRDLRDEGKVAALCAAMKDKDFHAVVEEGLKKKHKNEVHGIKFLFVAEAKQQELKLQKHPRAHCSKQ